MNLAQIFRAIAVASLAFLLPLPAQPSFPSFDQLPARAELPDVLTMLDGTKVSSATDWETRRKPELKALFQHYMYGQLPAPAPIQAALEREDRTFLGGKATLRQVAIRFAGADFKPIHLLVAIPNQRTGPAPVVVGLNFCGNHTVLADPSIPLPDRWMPGFCEGCTNNAATEAGRGVNVDGWAIAQSIERGYAIATFYSGDIEPDGAGAPGGVRGRYPSAIAAPKGPQAWGTIAAWAWGLHRAVDYLHAARDFDTNRIAVFGHSRNGKTALLAGAMDERIDLILCHQAGCGGSAPSRGQVGESVKQINDRFPHWFGDAFKAFNDRTDRLPFDQHALVALCAPRPVLLSNATEDTWANPEGQFEMLRAADPVYRLLGVPGLASDAKPAVGTLLDTRLGYFIRSGKHSTTPLDWKTFLDFADRQWARR